MQNKLKLMADYQCFPLWGSFDQLHDNIDPASLPISDDLKRQLSEWQATYNATLNQDDPAQSGFFSQRDEVDFEREGFKLWKALGAELPMGTVVSYFSERTCQEYFD